MKQYKRRTENMGHMGSPSAAAIEGIFGETIDAMHMEFNCFSATAQGMLETGQTPQDNVRAFYRLTFRSVSSFVRALEEMSDASLQPRHRFVRAIFKTFLTQLELIKKAIEELDEDSDVETHPACTTLAAGYLRFANAAHECMIYTRKPHECREIAESYEQATLEG